MWKNNGNDIWEMPVDVAGQKAVARVRPEGQGWSLRVFWNGTAHVFIGGYPSAAHAKHAVAHGVLRAMVERSRVPHVFLRPLAKTRAAGTNPDSSSKIRNG